MLVTLENNKFLAIGASTTATYSPQSLQKVFVFFDDDDASYQWHDCTITVQLGSKVLVNGAQVFGLVGLTQLQSGYRPGASDALVSIDFGSHEIADTNDNLYVTVRAGTTAINQVDISAIVDEPGLGVPLRYTEYSDNTFTSNNNLMSIAFKNDRTVLREDATNVEVRTSINSSAPSFISCSSWYDANRISGESSDGGFALLNKHSVPLRTTINYPATATANRVLTVEQDPITRSQVRAGRQSGRIATMQAGR